MTKMFYRPTWWSEAHHLLMQSWCQPWNIANMSNPALFPLVSSSFLSFPSFHLAAMLYLYLNFFFLPHAAQQHLIFSTHAFSHSPIAYCPHCLLPQGRKKRSLPPLRRKRGQAGSGADRTKPLPPWCVYRGCVTAMSERHGEKERDR